MVLTIVQIILFVLIIGSAAYNVLAKKKHWQFTIILLVFFIVNHIYEEMYEDEIMEQALYDQARYSRLQQNLEQPQKTTAVVESVLDGDTIKLSSRETVRLIGLNAPESGDKCFSEAKTTLEDLVLGKEITLETDIDDKDQYGRLLRYVFVDGHNVNYGMIYLGFAHKYDYGANNKYSNEFEQAENVAKKNEGCLWKSEEVKYIQDECIQIRDFHFNAAGDDNYNLNDEYVTFENTCIYSLNMEGWTIKDETASHVYTILLFTFPPDSTFTLYTGKGTNTASELYWGRSSGDYAAIWNNGG
ncbi:MAG: thermonuclease family protein, partial [Candidatus Woesearchaeota archaeon]